MYGNVGNTSLSKGVMMPGCRVQYGYTSAWNAIINNKLSSVENNNNYYNLHLTQNMTKLKPT